ncbi:hypothetical protein LINGRAHAP2_LOCUS6966 [Linum grandiflorum]
MNPPHPKPYPIPIPIPIPSPAVNKSDGDCTNCSSKASWLLHDVRHRRTYRRLCTSCVLLLHPSSFCPICFSIHGSAPPDEQPGELLRCSNCSSLTHSRCAPSHPLPPFPYLCPPCSDPTFSFFSPSTATGGVSIDAKMATALLCASKIAASSMDEAVKQAEDDAERMVKEAAVCRKSVKEALDRISVVAETRKKAASVSFGKPLKIQPKEE